MDTADHSTEELIGILNVLQHKRTELHAVDTKHPELKTYNRSIQYITYILNQRINTWKNFVKEYPDK
jgi:hypothetical protein